MSRVTNTAMARSTDFTIKRAANLAVLLISVGKMVFHIIQCTVIVTQSLLLCSIVQYRQYFDLGHTLDYTDGQVHTYL